MICCRASLVLGSHIVGGEFELLHISGNQYRVNLIIYFDQLNGAPGAKDPSVNASIYQKSNHTLVTTLLLTLSQELNVDYTQPECSNGEIVTRKLVYSTVVSLSPDTYNDEAGYYLVWQRCCRNYSITNINSPPPVSGGLYAGQTFYLEFPAVVRKGQPFINSSPYLFPPLNDYACPGKPYYVDFAGEDLDGDSLVYSMVTPLNTKTMEALPPSSPSPYPEVTWKPGYGLNNIINGMPDLQISQRGLLTATPLNQGLFVFAVKVEEFRHGEKIGESRRDFQMLVVDECAHAEPPGIVGKKLSDPDFNNGSQLSISFANTVADGDRCIKVRVSDPDASNPLDDFKENVRIRAVGLSFQNKNLTDILPEETAGILENGSTIDFDICFPACPLGDGGPYEVGIIAMDDACSLPLTDTLRVWVNVQPPENTNPYFVTNKYTNQQLVEGNQDEWAFEARDDDGDSLAFSFVTNGFVLDSAGMTLDIVDQQNGLIDGKLVWDAFCEIYNFTQRTEFQVQLVVEDVDQCQLENPDVAIYDLSVKLPGNADPIIDTDLTSNPLERYVGGLERKIFEDLSFKVVGWDSVDNDHLTLELVDQDSWAEHGISFERRTGNTSLESTFTWLLNCDNVDLEQQSEFDFQFIVVDNANKCRLYKADTVNVRVQILPPANSPPGLVIDNLNSAQVFVNNELQVTLGQQILLGLQGTDADLIPKKDELSLDLVGASGNVPPTGYLFEPVIGEGNVSTTFSWNPDCNIFQDGIYENSYEFRFRIGDDRCLTAKADTVTVKIKIKDLEQTNEGFQPINFFSPNGDGFNDYYSMEKLDADTGELRNILPLDNCTSRFQAIRIYNRWGNEVFFSTDRNFKWFAEGEAAGVYYYLIQYSDTEYKGPLSIRY